MPDTLSPDARALCLALDTCAEADVPHVLTPPLAPETPMHNTTPAGRERERLTGLILDHGHLATTFLILEIGAERASEAAVEKQMNGGGALDLRDYCAECNLEQLRRVCKKLRLI